VKYYNKSVVKKSSLNSNRTSSA